MHKNLPSARFSWSLKFRVGLEGLEGLEGTKLSKHPKLSKLELKRAKPFIRRGRKARLKRGAA